MFRNNLPTLAVIVGFPRIRGDVPHKIKQGASGGKFSPHTRGCSVHRHGEGPSFGVFPAYAGMFRSDSSFTRSMLGFPRIRGDVPHTAPIRWVLPEFSPHTRGCSGIIDDFKVTPKVFPAYAGMFLRAGLWISLPASFPRIRGDVPIGVYISPQRARFSPHTRGCSAQIAVLPAQCWVFPAYAGMFLGASPTAVGKWSFPRIRGDVPTEDGKHVLSGEFSPHTRGCSSGHQAGNAPGCVFPAYAGMFPHKHSKNASTRRFPRIRGDVPKVKI